MALDDVDQFVRHILVRYGNPKHRVLDVGCGPAPYRDWVSGQYIGLDVTDQPYRPDVPRRMDIVGSATALPLASVSVDMIFSKSAFCLVPDAGLALSEFLRVLKPGGRLMLLDYNRRTQRKLMASDSSVLPCWTQWQLKSLVNEAGFRDCELVVPKARDVGRLEYWLRLAHQELFGTWAVVTAIK